MNTIIEIPNVDIASFIRYNKWLYDMGIKYVETKTWKDWNQMTGATCHACFLFENPEDAIAFKLVFGV